MHLCMQLGAVCGGVGDQAHLLPSLLIHLAQSKGGRGKQT